MGVEFEIFSYVGRLEKGLNAVRPQGRVAFAVWCADPLLCDARAYLAARIGPTRIAVVDEAMEYLWQCAERNDHFLSEPAAGGFAGALVDVTWGTDDVSEDEQSGNFYAVESLTSLSYAIETCRTGSAGPAAKAAESVINKLDYEISQELGADSYSDAIFSHPKMKAELEAQKKMVVFLHDFGRLAAGQRRMFRS